MIFAQFYLFWVVIHHFSSKFLPFFHDLKVFYDILSNFNILLNNSFATINRNLRKNIQFVSYFKHFLRPFQTNHYQLLNILNAPFENPRQHLTIKLINVSTTLHTINYTKETNRRRIILTKKNCNNPSTKDENREITHKISQLHKRTSTSTSIICDKPIKKYSNVDKYHTRVESSTLGEISSYTRICELNFRSITRLENSYNVFIITATRIGTGFWKIRSN